MEGKTVDFTRTVYQLCTADPAISGILAEAGFVDVVKPGMLTTAGRFMTIPKGAAIKGIDMERVRRIFAAHGYAIKEGS
jgi:hypothetical protein